MRLLATANLIITAAAGGCLPGYLVCWGCGAAGEATWTPALGTGCEACRRCFVTRRGAPPLGRPGNYPLVEGPTRHEVLPLLRSRRGDGR